MLDLVFNAIPTFCHLLTANIGNLFDNSELNKYFLIVQLQQLNLFATTFKFDNVSQASAVSNLDANHYLKGVLLVNQKISEEIHTILLRCKETIYNNPGVCLTPYFTNATQDLNATFLN